MSGEVGSPRIYKGQFSAFSSLCLEANYTMPSLLSPLCHWKRASGSCCWNLRRSQTLKHPSSLPDASRYATFLHHNAHTGQSLSTSQFCLCRSSARLILRRRVPPETCPFDFPNTLSSLSVCVVVYLFQLQTLTSWSCAVTESMDWRLG